MIGRFHCKQGCVQLGACCICSVTKDMANQAIEDAGRAAEARIVAWLRKRVEVWRVEWCETGASQSLSLEVDAIERGEHHK